MSCISTCLLFAQHLTLIASHIFLSHSLHNCFHRYFSCNIVVVINIFSYYNVILSLLFLSWYPDDRKKLLSCDKTLHQPTCLHSHLSWSWWCPTCLTGDGTILILFLPIINVPPDDNIMFIILLKTDQPFVINLVIHILMCLGVSRLMWIVQKSSTQTYHHLMISSCLLLSNPEPILNSILHLFLINSRTS